MKCLFSKYLNLWEVYSHWVRMGDFALLSRLAAIRRGPGAPRRTLSLNIGGPCFLSFVAGHCPKLAGIHEMSPLAGRKYCVSYWRVGTKL